MGCGSVEAVDFLADPLDVGGVDVAGVEETGGVASGPTAPWVGCFGFGVGAVAVVEVADGLDGHLLGDDKVG